MSFETRNPTGRPIQVFTRIMFAGLLVLPLPALAQDAAAPAPTTATVQQPAPDSVVAKVGDETITESDIGFAAEDLNAELSKIPAAQRKPFLVSVLVDMKIMAQAARAANMQDTEIFKRRLSYLEDRSLRRAYFSEKVATQVTPDSIKAAYDKMVAAFKPVEQVHARHILVATEEEAKAIRAEIEGGKPFEVAAMEKSTDGSAKNGGDLGYFSKGQMVPEFETAAFALKVGDISQPVKSQFGWHLIKVEDKRMSSPPPMAQIAQQLQQQAMVDAFNADMAKLRTNAKVSFTDPAMEAAVKAEEQATN